MTSSITVSNALLSADIDELPRPDATSAGNSSNSTLPHEVTLPNIADSGRISFGAGFRLPAKK